MVEAILGEDQLARNNRAARSVQYSGVQPCAPSTRVRIPRWRTVFRRFEGAFSDHTVRSYQSAFVSFAAWCRKHRKASMPAAPQTVALYVEQEGKRLRASTIRHRLSAIRKVHQICGASDPTTHVDVELAMRRLRRSQLSRPRQAHGITANLRDQLLSVCSNDLTGLRNKVMISVGFETLCRRGELVAIAIEDLTPKGDGRYTVLVRRAKNDPEGSGRIAHLSSRTSALVDEWLNTIGARKGPLLRPVYGNVTRALHLAPATVSCVLKKCAAACRLERQLVERVSGHSLRVGAAQQLTLDGCGILQIMRVGGWRSMNVVARYVENMDIDVWS